MGGGHQALMDLQGGLEGVTVASSSSDYRGYFAMNPLLGTYLEPFAEEVGGVRSDDCTTTCFSLMII